MKQILIISLSLVLVAGLSRSAAGQDKYLTREGTISFYSHTILEDITAVNDQVGSVLDGAKGSVAVVLRMTGFRFEKKLMQEHFNENYVESEQYPKSTFNGTILNNREVDYSSPGIYPVSVEGDLTLHGVTRKISAEGTVEVTAGAVTARTKFMINPGDYDIRIPRVVRDNIAEHLEVTVELPHRPI